MFISGLLIKGKTSLSNLVGMESSIQVENLDQDNIVISSWRSIGRKRFQTLIRTPSISSAAELEFVEWFTNVFHDYYNYDH